LLLKEIEPRVWLLTSSYGTNSYGYEGGDAYIHGVFSAPELARARYQQICVAEDADHPCKDAAARFYSAEKGWDREKLLEACAQEMKLAAAASAEDAAEREKRLQAKEMQLSAAERAKQLQVRKDNVLLELRFAARRENDDERIARLEAQARAIIAGDYEAYLRSVKHEAAGRVEAEHAKRLKAHFGDEVWASQGLAQLGRDEWEYPCDGWAIIPCVVDDAAVEVIEVPQHYHYCPRNA